jgi:fructokinase
MKKITAIGEIIFDIYPDIKKLGGAPLNFIYHINKLTKNGQFISRVGDDDPGHDAISFLKKNNIPVDYIQIDKEYETGAAFANLDKNKIPHWDIPTDRAYDFINIPPESEQIIENTSCFYFGSLAQRTEKSRTTIQSFFGSEIKYFLDLNIRQNYYTKHIISRSLTAADVLKVNEEELNLLHDMFFLDKFNIAECAHSLMENFRIELIAVTMGSEGAYLFNKENSDFYKENVNYISDTVGAGDAYSAILAIGYLNGWGLVKINKLASEFAGEIIKIPGALPADDLIYEHFRKYL